MLCHFCLCKRFDIPPHPTPWSKEDYLRNDVFFIFLYYAVMSRAFYTAKMCTEFMGLNLNKVQKLDSVSIPLQ